MGPEGRVLFANRMGRSTWLLIFGAMLVGLGIGFWDGGDWSLFLPVFAGLALLVVISLYVAGRWLGRTQVSCLVETDRGYDVEMLNLFGPGRRVSIARDEATNWRRVGRGRYRYIYFDAGGLSYSLPLWAAQHVDEPRLAALTG